MGLGVWFRNEIRSGVCGFFRETGSHCFGSRAFKCEVLDVFVDDVSLGSGTEFPDGRFPGDISSLPSLELLEDPDCMEEFAFRAIDEGLAEGYGVVFLGSRIKRLRNSGDLENLGEDVGAAHGWLLSEEMEC